MRKIFNGKLHENITYVKRCKLLEWEFPHDDIDDKLYADTFLKWINFCYGQKQEFKLEECNAALLVLQQLKLKCEKEVKKMIEEFKAYIEEKEEVIAASLNDLNDRLETVEDIINNS